MTPPDATADDHDVVRSFLLQAGNHLRDQCLVTSGLGGDADNVHIVFDRFANRFVRRLKEWSDVDVETDIGEGRRDHLGAAVVPVLAEFADQHARAAALAFFELDGPLS
jgi:hypothetical protein